MVLFEQLPVNSWLVVETFDVRPRDQLDEVLVAASVLSQNCHVIGAFIVRVLRKAAAGRDVHLAAYDWLDARVFRQAIEVDYAVHAAVVGDSEAVHA